MKVKELLEALKTADPDANIDIFSSKNIPMYDCEEVKQFEIKSAKYIDYEKYKMGNIKEFSIRVEELVVKLLTKEH